MKLAFYKGTRSGLPGLANRLVRWWTGGPYSHVELVLEHEPHELALCASSSFMDGGVRLKWIELHPARWDVVDLGSFGNAELARGWFIRRAGQGYDVLGLAGFIWRRRDGSRRRWTCSEACAAALGLPEPWRFCPNTLRAVVRVLSILRPI
jgi:hypothetical protein